MNGVVIIDKPAGKTSHDVVAIVKKALGARKAGHTGTLDPLATGVLPVCLNEATKLARFFSSATKDYRATMRLGIETDTQDLEGKVLARREVDVAAGDVETALKRYVGEIDQKPPGYSAVKFKGQALYKWARKGILIDLPPRKVSVYRIILEDVALPDVTFSVSCSAGTYIRSLCAAVGEDLGCGACLSGLRRTRSGVFEENSAVSCDNGDILRSRIIPMTEAVSHLPAITVGEPWMRKLQDGVQPDADCFRGYDISFLAPGDMLRFVTEEGRLVAIAAVAQSREGTAHMTDGVPDAKILRIFHDQ